MLLHDGAALELCRRLRQRRIGLIEPALLKVRPAQRVEERRIVRLDLQRALHQLDRFVQPFTTLGKHVAERVQRVGILGIAGRRDREACLRPPSTSPRSCWIERQHVKAADIVRVGGQELARRALGGREILDRRAAPLRGGTSSRHPAWRMRSRPASRMPRASAAFPALISASGAARRRARCSAC